jgi:hypothetical protein
MMEVQPPEVTVLRPGTFSNYYKKKKENGLMLAQRKPARMNPSDEVLEDLISNKERQYVQVS